VTQRSAADEDSLRAIIEQHQKVRLQLPAEDQSELDPLVAHVRKQLFVALPPTDLVESATRIVRETVPGLTALETTSLAEYALGGIAAGSSGAELDDDEELNRLLLRCQQAMDEPSRLLTILSNMLATKRDTLKSSTSNLG